MFKTMLIAATLLAPSAVLADEVIIHREAAPVVVEPAPAPAESTTTIEKHVTPDGCASKTVHSENDQGDSKTVHTERCD